MITLLFLLPVHYGALKIKFLILLYVVMCNKVYLGNRMWENLN